MMTNWRVILDDNINKKTFSVFLPFNLKKDIKKYKINEMDLVDYLLVLLNKDYRGPSFVDIYYQFLDVDKIKYKISYAKIRYTKTNDNHGKSGGYRLIVLVDMYSKLAIVLHIYSKKDCDNITKAEEKLLRDLIDAYFYSKNKEINNEKYS